VKNAKTVRVSASSTNIELLFTSLYPQCDDFAMIFLTSHIRFGHTTAIAAAIMCFSPDLVVVMIVIMRDHSYTSGYVSRLISDDIQLTTTDAKIYFRAVEWLSQPMAA
jgi:hypothetical protein